ncbi:hypothetical protein [Streptomyces cavernicola]|uniref:Type II toxin-antitoxin system RelE/ParE family toxin n=1 Tax=Streptomyces cavernicola TaxID=3043613 RepID=A0ABT6SKA8_9ACTN|nr:hypothetical protein [Streptomyces sp. B-S-A6]MDI3408375.1 hypothetical protein [Streptomyces sp. B-S-A6]
MSEQWPAHLSPRAAQTLSELPEHVGEMTRDALDLASRSPWGWPQWDPTDPEGEDVRRAEVGPLTVVYTVNRPGAHLYVLAVSWAG